MKRSAPSTPVRRVLRPGSKLRTSVLDGLGAVEDEHRSCFEEAIREAFADSLDLDKALRPDHENEHRWDYLLGHRPSNGVIAVEPHSAKEDEIRTVIKKKTAAGDQLRAHLRDGAKVVKWLWVAPGRIRFADTERLRRQLDQNGIEFVGCRVAARHLPIVDPTTSTPRPSRRRRRVR